MTQGPDRFLNRMRWGFLLFAIILVLWQFLPWIVNPMGSWCDDLSQSAHYACSEGRISEPGYDF